MFIAHRNEIGCCESSPAHPLENDVVAGAPRAGDDRGAIRQLAQDQAMNGDIAKVELITAAGIEISNRGNPTGEVDVKNLCLVIGHKKAIAALTPHSLRREHSAQNPSYEGFSDDFGHIQGAIQTALSQHSDWRN